MKTKSTNATITVKGTDIAVIRRDGEFFISDWLRNRNTVEFLGIWETVHNPEVNSGEFAIVGSKDGYKHSIESASHLRPSASSVVHLQSRGES